MQFVCGCLNVEISVPKSPLSSGGSGGIRKLCEINGEVNNTGNLAAVQKLSCDPETLGLSAAAMCHSFFSTCGPWLWKVRAEECVVNLRVPVLVRSKLVGHLNVHQCLLCGTKAYATPSSNSGTTDQSVLIRNSMINDESVITDLRKSSDLSPVFGVLLPKVGQVPPMMINTNGSTATTTATAAATDDVCSRQCLSQVQLRVDSYLKAEQEAMEERIRVYVDQQSAAFEALKSQVKAQKNVLLSVLSQKVLESTGAKEDEGDSAVPLSPLSLNSGDISPGPNANMSALPSGNKFSTGQLNRASNQVHVDVAGDIGDSQEPMERMKSFSNPGNMLAWKRKRHSGGPGRVRGLSHFREEEPEVFSLDEHGDQLAAGDDYSTDGEDSGTGEDIGKYLPDAKLAANDYDDFDEDDHFPTDAKALAAQMSNGPKVIRSNRATEVDELGKSLPVRIPQRWTLVNKSEDEEIQVGRGSERKPLGMLSDHNSVVTSFVQQQQQMENVEPLGYSSNNWEEKLGHSHQGSVEMGMDDGDIIFGHIEGIPQDITAESFQVLARSLHPADDPERLFGDRPNRRRYRTGEVMRAQPLRDF